MNLVTRSSSDWHPVMTADTTIASYWLNWRFFLCAILVLISMIISSILLWKKERCPKVERGGGGGQDTQGRDAEACLYDDETWRPCLKEIHPACLLAFRICAFFVLLVLLVFSVLVNGGSLFYFYTQWTCTLVTIYFGLGVFLSIHGCLLYHKRASGDKVDHVGVDAEQGQSVSPALGRNSNSSQAVKSQNTRNDRQLADKWAFAFQIIFQMNAGAVLLTDSVFWFIIFPFFAIKDYQLNALTIIMHSVNAVFLLGDTALNSLPFPPFRIAYFFMWTITYVVFLWIVHSRMKIWWPYPFLDLSSSYAPLWYFTVEVMHIPCYGFFCCIEKLKSNLFKKWFGESYQCRAPKCRWGNT